MKRFAFCIALLLAAGTACTSGGGIIRSETESEPIRIVGTVQTASPIPEAPTLTDGEPAATTGLPALTEILTAIPTERPGTPLPTPDPTATPTPTETPTPIEELTPVPTETPAPAETSVPDVDRATRFVLIAESMLDKPYVRGGTDENGFDPGGFVYYCLNKAGYSISHRSSKGYAEVEAWTKIDTMDDLQKGDICFFMTPGNESVNCACIYQGDGMMIYPSSGRGVVISTKLHTSYWEAAFVFARRVF